MKKETAVYSDQEKHQLLALAKSSVQLASQGISEKDIHNQLSAADSFLIEIRACFVSLHKGKDLRGCIGSLEAYRSLNDDIIHNAISAAQRDPRFPPVTEDELESLTVEVSVLSPVTTLEANDEDDLLEQLNPHVDGLIIDNGMGHRATFLPQVWEQLPDKKEFLAHLKRKAGLAVDVWPKNLQCYRYHCEAFHEVNGY